MLVRALAPVLSFTAEEIWQQIPGSGSESVFLQDNAAIDALLPAYGGYLKADGPGMAQLLAMRDAVGKVLEPMRAEGQLGAALQAEVTVYADDAAIASLPETADELRFLFITSQLQLAPLASAPADAVAVEGSPFKVLAKVSGHGKCVRCWHYSASVGTDAGDPELCGRCIGNIHGPGETRRFF